MPEDIYYMPIIRGAYYILKRRDNYAYAALDIKIILYYRADGKTSLILLSVLGKNALDSLYLLGSRGIYGDNRGHAIEYYIYTWLLISILD
jgi:hypothetical protein